MWTKTNKKYFQKWKCKVYCEEELIYDSVYDATDKKVFITLTPRLVTTKLLKFIHWISVRYRKGDHDLK